MPIYAALRSTYKHWLLCLSLLGFLAQPSIFAQDTAYPPEDAQIPGPAAAKDFPAWLADLQHWRSERLVRMGYDGSNYSRPDFKWTQRNFVCVQMMIEDKATQVKSCSNYIALSGLRDSTSVARRLLPSNHADSICVHFNEGLTS